MCGVPEDTKLMHLFMHKIVQVSFQSGCFCFQRHFSFFPFTLLSLVRLEDDRKWTKRLGERGLLIQAWPHTVFKVLQLNCIFSICIVYTVLAESNTFNLMQKGNGEVFFPGKWNQLLTVFSKQWHHQHLDWLPLRSAFIFTIPAPSENKSKLAKLGEKKITFFCLWTNRSNYITWRRTEKMVRKMDPFFFCVHRNYCKWPQSEQGCQQPSHRVGRIDWCLRGAKQAKEALGNPTSLLWEKM